MNDDEPVDRAPGHEPREDGPRTPEERRYSPAGVAANTWVRRGVLVLVGLALAYLVYLLAAAFFPRWWAQRVADQVGGGLTAGILWGLFYGVVFTALPLLVLAQVRRRFLSRTWRLVVVVVALLLAAPNWLTLSVVVGSSNAAHAGERIFDVDAPGFRVATAIGSASGAVLAIALVVASLRLSRRRREVKDLKGRLAERERADQERDSAD